MNQLYKIIFFIGIASSLSANVIDARYPPLFANVIGVAEDDLLNVREKPHYETKKVGTLPPKAYIGIQKCQKIINSTWCRVYQIAQNFYSDDFKPGWVNARYLKPKNRGYVIIDGKKNCDCALRCNRGKCEVLKSYQQDKNHNISSIKTHWVARDRLMGESHFGAMNKEGDGYCGMMKYIDNYFMRKKIDALKTQCNDDECDTVLGFTQKLRVLFHKDRITPYIHPKKGVVMTWNVRFGGKEDKRFTQKDILNMKVFDKNKIYWGQTYGKGDDVRMNLYRYMEMLTRPIADITRIDRLKDTKGFRCSSPGMCRGYELFWVNENSDTKEYDWLGLVIIVEKIEGKWYVVGLLRDRWTI